MITPLPPDTELIAALRQGDEAAFMLLVEHYHLSMTRIAAIYVKDHAEDVVQETWLAILKGLEHFEGRSSLKTWMFRILTNRAKTRAQKEGRYFAMETLPDQEPAVDADRFQLEDQAYPGHWASPPHSWEDIPEDRLLSDEVQGLIRQTIEKLPPNQRSVITLRDLEGWSSEEICNTLDLSETNQRVLLHRARSQVRHVLEEYFA